jgi:hypothetical protein
VQKQVLARLLLQLLVAHHLSVTTFLRV